QSAPI
ncbi:hypothetical protein CP08DC60_1358B, partial [Chlamydia psittaci 08DC60]